MQLLFIAEMKTNAVGPDILLINGQNNLETSCTSKCIFNVRHFWV